MENTGVSKLETIMNEMVDLNLNFDHTYSVSDSVNIGSMTGKPDDEVCSSLHFLTPIV